MATHDYVIANGTGASVRSDLNNALAAIVSNNSSSSEPSTRYAYQWWADTTTGQLKLRNAANNGWVTIFELDGTMLMEDGTVSAPGLAFASDLNTGFFSGGADKLNFATGGVERLEIGSSEVVFNDGSNDVDFRVESNGQTHMLFVDGGNDAVGIGTSSPSKRLHTVGGDVRFDGAGGANTGILQIEPGSSPSDGATLTATYTGSGSYGPLKIITGASERMRILSDGTIATAGLTATPGTVAAGSYIQHAANAGFFGNNGDAKFGSSANNPVLFQVNGSEKARLDTSGRLLVGTSSGSGEPIAAFQGRSTDASDGAMIALTRSGATPSGTIGIIQFATGSDYAKNYSTIISASDGTVSSSSTPGMLRFSTTAAGATSATERFRVDASGSLLIGKTERSINTAGVSIGHADDNGVKPGALITAVDGDACLFVNRLTSDGTLVSFRRNNSQEGTINVSGSTVSYVGAHLSRWSQLAAGAERIEILRGSVLSNLDEMCEWGEEDNEQLNRMKVSDTEGDKNVSGVFQSWDDDDKTYTNDFYCAMTGDFVIRIAQGTTVARGDLLMSAGDGTAKPQDDDIVRSKTIAKVTSTSVSETYADNSYCVPCVLMAC